MPEVVQLRARRESEDLDWQKRLAIDLARQLPEKPADALAVVALLDRLVRTFLMPGEA